MLCLEETLPQEKDALEAVGERINTFSLVHYLPTELAVFLDVLRKQLVPGCVPHAHVTLLPPRPLLVDGATAWRELRERFRESEPFEVELRSVEIFERTCVVYVSVGKGWEELQAAHARFNQGHTWYQEPYPYHPHITVAQQITPAQVQEVYMDACRAWVGFPGAKKFYLDRATFVQATNRGLWVDLEEERFG